MVTFSRKLNFELKELDMLYCKKERWSLSVHSGLRASRSGRPTDTTVRGFSSAKVCLNTCWESPHNIAFFGALAGGNGGLLPLEEASWGICGDPWEEGEAKDHYAKNLQNLLLLLRLPPFQLLLCSPRGSITWAIEKWNLSVMPSFFYGQCKFQKLEGICEF